MTPYHFLLIVQTFIFIVVGFPLSLLYDKYRAYVDIGSAEFNDYVNACEEAGEILNVEDFRNGEY